MSETKHTPGPWEVVSGDDYYIEAPVVYRDKKWVRLNIGDRESSYIAEVSNGPDDFGEANARLIAAAPDLLAAAEQLIRDLNRRIDEAHREGRPVPVFLGIGDLHSAIAKAKGGKP